MPVTKLESLEARKSAAVAISSGGPILPRGMSATNPRNPGESRENRQRGVSEAGANGGVANLSAGYLYRF